MRSAQNLSLVLPLLFWSALSAACGGGPRGQVMSAVEANDLELAIHRYERYREAEGADPQLLAHVAALLLEEAAAGDDPSARTAALAQLGLAGTAGRDSLQRLAQPGRELALRARALELLAAAGDRGAREELRGLLGTEDWAVLAAAVTVLGGASDQGALLSFLEHPAEGVRAASARSLADAAPAGAVRAALAEAARVDPAPSVRAAAVNSLGAFGVEAFALIQERLADPESRVRLAAVRALVRADREAALSVLGPLLDMAPSPAGIEAARVLAGGARQAGDEVPAGHVEGETLARAYLRRALEVSAPTIRGQAAVALASLSGVADLGAILSEAAESEQDPQVRLGIATILARDESTQAKGFEVLGEIMLGDGIPAVGAAAFLARAEVAAAKTRLAVLMASPTANVRRVAARALARDAVEPDAARGALKDEDVAVRISAAGGILAAQNA